MTISVNVVHGKQREVLKTLLREYGDDANLVLNALHEITVRVAISTGVTPDAFAAGMKHHWDFLANAIDEYAEGGSVGAPQ